MDLAINDFVEVKASGIRFGHRGRVVNRFTRNRLLYAVQFPDDFVGFFDRSELEKIPLEDVPDDWKKGIGFRDINDLVTGL